jgi:hypothetical protein
VSASRRPESRRERRRRRRKAKRRLNQRKGRRAPARVSARRRACMPLRPLASNPHTAHTPRVPSRQSRREPRGKQSIAACLPQAGARIRTPAIGCARLLYARRCVCLTYSLPRPRRPCVRDTVRAPSLFRRAHVPAGCMLFRTRAAPLARDTREHHVHVRARPWRDVATRRRGSVQPPRGRRAPAWAAIMEGHGTARSRARTRMRATTGRGGGGLATGNIHMLQDYELRGGRPPCSTVWSVRAQG